MAADVAVVVIGRDEGERLVRCLEALRGFDGPVVYVDSASSDGSPARARELGVDVVEVDASRRLTAARGRNAGLAHLRERGVLTEFVQFVDGDCVLAPGWLEAAAAALRADPALAAVCGRLREVDRAASLWNRLADIEWDGPVGEVRHCGGIAMYRSAPLLEVGAFDETIAAGEEPELCLRLRRLGLRLRRLPHEMAAHDIAMTRFSQWWRRTARAGRAYAAGKARHGTGPERFCVRECRSIVFWGGVVPGLALALAWPTHGLSLLLLAGHVVLGWRVFRAARRAGRPRGDAALWAAACVVGKPAQFLGLLGARRTGAPGARP